MEKTVLAISGKPGLFALVSRGKGMLIVEAIDATHKRMPVGERSRVTSVNDIAIYTQEDDVPLLDVFASIKAKEGGAPVAIDTKKATKEELAAYMAEVLPTYDRDRVYTTDIKKVIQWYNILVTNGINDFEEEKAPQGDAESAEA